MRIARLLVFLLLLLLAPAVARAQETEPPDGTRIATALVSGLDLTRLSAPLQEEINKLPGTALSRPLLRDLAARIETEQPRYIAGVRVSADPDGGARVVFVVARMRDEQREQNINSRYVVEAVEIRGVPERDLDPVLVADLHALAGRQLDSAEAERLETRMREALRDYDVRRRMVRGNAPPQVKLIFTAARAEWARWLRYEPAEANTIFHSDQGWGAVFPISMNGRDVSVMPIITIDNGDDLVEEYSGFGLRFESRKLGTERLGVFFEWSTFDQTWRTPTLAALALDPSLSAPYRNRMNVTSLVKFAITPELTIGGGVSITELDPLLEPPFELEPSRMSNAAIGSVSFTRRVRPDSSPRQNVDAAFTVRAGTSGLESDLVFERYLGQAAYSTRWSHHRVLVSGMAGRIDGQAPLFERFSLGDSQTLRGWDKYDIAPAGGDRMFHTSVEYRFHELGWFLDTGAVWNGGAERRVRASAGLTYAPGPVFFTVGFPLNTDEFRAVFTMGLRFPSASARISKH
jgi:hypothetical protein